MMKTLQNVFETNSALKEARKERLTKRLTHSSMLPTNTPEPINAMFREGKDGRVYGLTLVDNRKCTVFNGSALGKRYSGQNLAKSRLILI
jgi:hypothetical protein